MNHVEKIQKMLEAVTGGCGVYRLQVAVAAYEELSAEDQAKFRIEECSDEATGRRYGNRKCRKGRCCKVGGGGRNRGSGYAYQIWAVWN